MKVPEPSLFDQLVQRTTLLVVDGTNLLTRGSRVAPDLSNEAGEATGAVMLYVNQLSRYVREVEATHIVVCWDGGRSVHRSSVDEHYKEGRGEGNPEPELIQACDFNAFAGIPQVMFVGYEADDLVAKAVRGWDERAVILSSDKDLLQLVDDGRVSQMRPGQDGIWTRRRVVREFGVDPIDIPLSLALAGDSSDGIDGIRGIGKKTAAKLINEYGHDIDTMCSEVKRLSEDDAVTIRRNLQLTDLSVVDVPDFDEIIVRFEPTGPGAGGVGMASWFDAMELATLRDRWEAGTLWNLRPTTTV